MRRVLRNDEEEGKGNKNDQDKVEYVPIPQDQCNYYVLQTYIFRQDGTRSFNNGLQLLNTKTNVRVHVSVM